MLAYIVRRLLLIVPTLLGIMVINFAIVQLAPGGPIEQIIAEISGTDAGTTGRISGGGSEISGGASQAAGGASTADSGYRGAQGLDPDFIKELEKQFGFDKPMHERFLDMIANFIVFDFGTSFFRDETVIDLVLEKMPVSISLGLWTTLIIYLVYPARHPQGVEGRHSVRCLDHNAAHHRVRNPVLRACDPVDRPVLGRQFPRHLPPAGLVSEDFDELSLGGQILDYLWHLVLPVTALVLGGFLSLTMLTKNSYLDQINMLYVQTARAKGLSEKRVMYGHVFRNAMLIVIAGFPSAFVGILFTGAMLIEIIFSLDGLGLLGFEAAIKRDYPVMFATVYFFTLLGLVMNLVGDLMYTIIDPRIDFEGRHV